MNAAWWMAGGAALSAIAVAALPGVDSDREVLFGMAGPLAGALLTWMLVQRVYTSGQPERLTSVMVAAFAAKMVFFGAYVTLMLAVLSVAAVPFVISFTTYFITLYAVEALWMHRLFAAGTQAPR